jgi:hypothetical protein
MTGLERAQLLGTGLMLTYYQQVVGVIGRTIAMEMWAIVAWLASLSSDELDESNRHELIARVKFGLVALNIIQLLYWGSWIELSPDWRCRYGTSPQDMTGFTSAAGYIETIILITGQ